MKMMSSAQGHRVLEDGAGECGGECSWFGDRCARRGKRERERERIRNSQCVMQGIGRGYKKRLSVVICDG